MRAVGSCPYRKPLDPHDAGEVAVCGFLGDLTGLIDPAETLVGADACHTCCQYPVPSHHVVNPVIASMVSIAAERVIAAGGRPGCSAMSATRLKRWADGLLRIEFPETIDPELALPLRAKQPCCHLGALIENASDDGDRTGGSDLLPRVCHHPNHVTTTALECHRCRDWAERPRPEPRPLCELLPGAEPRGGPPVRRWAVGVRTAPRTPPSLDWSLDSLARAGWEEPRVFADGAVERSARSCHLPMTLRDTPIGAWPRWDPLESTCRHASLSIL